MEAQGWPDRPATFAKSIRLALCAKFPAKANIVLTTYIQNVYKVYQVFGNDTKSLPGVDSQHALGSTPGKIDSD
jgi:hypothetical protein